MGLTMGTGPFGKKPAGAFNFEPDPPREHALYLEPSPRRVRGVSGGETVVDSTDVALLHETGYLPVWYFPRSDVRFDLLEATDHTTHCPFKGDAVYWTIRAGSRIAENKVWGYPQILPGDARDHGSSGVLLGCGRSLVRGGRGGLRPPARSVPPRRHRAELALRQELARRRRARGVDPAHGGVRDRLADALVSARRATFARRSSGRPRSRRAPTRARRPTGTWAATRTSPGATRRRYPSRPRSGASWPSTTRSWISTSTASARSAATRPSPRPGAAQRDEHGAGDAHGDARAPYRHQPRELSPRRP